MAGEWHRRGRQPLRPASCSRGCIPGSAPESTSRPLLALAGALPAAPGSKEGSKQGAGGSGALGLLVPWVHQRGTRCGGAGETALPSCRGAPPGCAGGAPAICSRPMLGAGPLLSQQLGLEGTSCAGLWKLREWYCSYCTAQYSTVLYCSVPDILYRTVQDCSGQDFWLGSSPPRSQGGKLQAPFPPLSLSSLLTSSLLTSSLLTSSLLTSSLLTSSLLTSEVGKLPHF